MFASFSDGCKGLILKKSFTKNPTTMFSNHLCKFSTKKMKENSSKDRVALLWRQFLLLPQGSKSPQGQGHAQGHTEIKVIKSSRSWSIDPWSNLIPELSSSFLYSNRSEWNTLYLNRKGKNSVCMCVCLCVCRSHFATLYCKTYEGQANTYGMCLYIHNVRIRIWPWNHQRSKVKVI